MVYLHKTFYILWFCTKKSNVIKVLCISSCFPCCRTKPVVERFVVCPRKILQYLHIMLKIKKKKNQLIFITYKALPGLTYTYLLLCWTNESKHSTRSFDYDFYVLKDLLFSRVFDYMESNKNSYIYQICWGKEKGIDF